MAISPPKSHCEGLEVLNLLNDLSDDKAAITAVLKKYQDALNESSTSSVLELYTADGVFMAQHFQTAVGTEQVREAYDKTFNLITLSVEFNIIEVVPVSDEWAFARTASAGTTKVKAGGGGAEANQELFVLQKIDGYWKIARYCFSTTNPPH
ncbi:hypothetical protein D0Z07_0118 [Hyphodiscus hymeniophilus]|uniref:SnoaL-like domain-containing protein n=1 Tax=Hyphodiscus hymeniophilus TaxID=353542 RepID=A0A9P6VSU7_9HELO|nr:hypothetical protein D0Z07_0118 [Hyphodiscus hymeniophilus]